MVFLKNIIKSGDRISCDYSPENSAEIGFVEVDLGTRDFVKKVRTPFDNDSDRYTSKVKFKLLDLAKLDEIPSESRVVWY
jgi:hypothetical protein